MDDKSRQMGTEADVLFIVINVLFFFSLSDYIREGYKIGIIEHPFFLYNHYFCIKIIEKMDEKEFKTIYIEDFKKNKEKATYVDDDFVIIDTWTGIPDIEDSVKLGCFLVALCLEGSVQLEVDNRRCLLQAGDLLLGQPGAIIQHTMITPNNRISLVGFSSSFLQQTVKIGKEIWDTTVHIYNNPVKPADEKNSNLKLFKAYKEMILTRINEEPHRYNNEVIRHLFTALFCDLIGILGKSSCHQRKDGETQENGIRQADYILYQFMELLSQDDGSHRSVKYYADILCYSPKYLSTCIKMASGRTALDLINENVIERIKYRLMHSDKSIKELAIEFDFPNPSFFGKYVKAKLGISPANYRNIKE